MWEYIAVLLLGFWLGVAIFLYVSCYWLEEIFDLPARDSPSSSHHHPTPSASGAHIQLKRLVARVVEEAAALPALARYAAEPTSPGIETTTYEDLLATAILNKVIERYQTENGSGGRSSGIHSASASPTPSERSSPRSLHSRARDISPPLREEDEDLSDWEEGEATASDEALELPRRVPFPEFGGDIVHATDNDDRDFDEVSGSDIQAVDGSWEENWLFQKKKIKNIQSVPVPMLVPNSNADYRALIGDRDADDTTDLSDNASEAEEEEAEFKSDIKRVLDSKHVIGGKSKIDELFDIEPDSLTIIDAGNEFEDDEKMNNNVVDAINNEINKGTIAVDVNDKSIDSEEDRKDSVMILGIDSGPLTTAEFLVKEEIHRALLNGTVEDLEEKHDVKVNGDSKDEVDSFNKGSSGTLGRHEREGEYEETVTKPVQRYADSLRRQHFEEPQQIPTRDTDKDDLIPGSIAYRERKKWLNYVDMPNNPYSPEAIKRRLSARSTSSLFDTLTSRSISMDLDEDRSIKSEALDFPEKEENNNKMLHVNITNGDRSKSPSPKILKDVLAEEVPQFKRYGRDYYIREAKASSGARRRREELSGASSMSSLASSELSSSTSALEASALHHSLARAVLSPRGASPNFAINPIFEQRPDSEPHPAPDGLLIQQFKTIASNQQYTKFAKNQITESITTLPNNKTAIMIEYDDATEHNVFNAKPAYVEDDTDRKFEEILQTVSKQTEKEAPKSPVSPTDTSYISTSSMDDSIKIYNVQTGEIMKSKPDSVSVRYETGDGTDTDTDKTLSEQAATTASEHSDVDEDSFEIIERDSLKGEKLDFVTELDDILPQLPSVKELAKKFVSMENLNESVKPQAPLRRMKSKENLFDPKVDRPKAAYMHSLTARSISKEFREELKLSMATPLKVPGGSNETPEGPVIKESSRPGSPLPEPGNLKSKLAFFESLRSRFSSK